MKSDARIYVAGAGTMTGAALTRILREEGYTAIAGAGSAEPDPHNQSAIDAFFDRERPEYVFLLAGRTAGIGGNQRFPADLMIDNLTIASHVIPAAWRAGARKLLYLSSSCTYPKLAPQPLEPGAFWTGPVEPTSAAYAVAKLAGATLCDAYRRQHGARFFTAISADAYGPGDDYSSEDAHVVGALLRRMHDARVHAAPEVVGWGTGSPRREFIYVDDLARACLFAMQHYAGDAPINLGTGRDTSIRELAETIRDVVGYTGSLRFDASKTDGMPFKGLDSSVLRGLGWRPQWDLKAGLERTYAEFLKSGHS
jgi:GDP-L-fucose synthase